MSQVESKSGINLSIRWMIRRDMPEVLAIEAESFDFPWLEEDFIRCLRGRNSIGMVAEYCDKVVGFMVYELAREHINLLNMAVAPKFQRQSVGTQMVEKLKSKVSATRRKTMTAEVRSAVSGFFLKQGFRETHILLARCHITNKTVEQSEICVRRNTSGAGIEAFIPDKTNLMAIQWLLKTMESFSEQKKKQTEFGIARKILEKYIADHPDGIQIKEIVGALTAVGMYTAEPGSLIRAGRIVVSEPWLANANAVKEALINELCRMAFARQCWLFAEFEESDLPLYQSFGFVLAGRFMEYEARP